MTAMPAAMTAPTAPSDSAAPQAEPDGAKAPLVEEVALWVQGSQSGPLHDGGTVTSGDRMQVSIRTSEDAYLYLVYCTHERELAVSPVQGSIRARARRTTLAPDPNAEIVLDDETGPEALYVIVSRTDLSSLDQRFVKATAASGPGGVVADCGMKRAPAPRTLPAGKPAVATRDATPAAAKPRKPREVTIERGAQVFWNGAPAVTPDAEGIVILRYGLSHVAAAPRATRASAPSTALAMPGRASTR